MLAAVLILFQHKRNVNWPLAIHDDVAPGHDPAVSQVTALGWPTWQPQSKVQLVNSDDVTSISACVVRQFN